MSAETTAEDPQKIVEAIGLLTRRLAMLTQPAGEDVAATALAMPPEERCRLALRLVGSLGGFRSDIDLSWSEKAARALLRAGGTAKRWVHPSDEGGRYVQINLADESGALLRAFAYLDKLDEETRAQLAHLFAPPATAAGEVQP